MQRRYSYPFFIILLSFVFSIHSSAQPTWTFEPFGKQKKPEQYESKKLPSEKTEDRKFTFLEGLLKIHSPTTIIITMPIIN